MRTTAAVLMMVAAALLQPVAARAQRTTLTVTGFPVTFAPTGADFDAGAMVSAAAVTFTVNAQTGTTAQRTTTVSIRCEAPCPTTGSKPLSTLLWRRADLGTWNTLSTSDVVIESRPVFRSQPLPASNDPWSNSIFFQIQLDWLNDPPSATAHSYGIIMTLTVTVP